MMRIIIIIVCSVTLLFSCSYNKTSNSWDNTLNQLEENEQTIEMTYISWFCSCPDWISTSDYNNYPDSLGFLCVYIEPADNGHILPDTIGYSGDIVKFTGHFYKDKGFPKGFEKHEEQPEQGRVFQYNKYQIIESNYDKFQTDSIKN